MTATADAERPASFIEDLDTRQNDVIRELDRLNERIEQLLEDWSSQQHAIAQPGSGLDFQL